MEKIPVLFLAGTNDRALIACVRSLYAKNIPFHICLPKQKYSLWLVSSYKKNILTQKYHSPDSPLFFKQSLENILKELGQVVLFPTGEKVIRILLSDPTWLEKTQVIFPVVDLVRYLNVSDKASFSELCVKYGIRVPRIFTGKSIKLNKPFVAKPKKNFDQKGNKLLPYLIFSNNDLDLFLNQETFDNYFIQEYIEGQSIYYCAIYEDGIEKQFFIQKILCQQPGGKSVINACPITANILELNKIRKLLFDIRWQGVIMIEFRLSDNGNYYMIEANPRFWGPLQLAVDNGYNFPFYLYQMSVGNKSPYYTTDEVVKRFGYKWMSGYINGLLLKWLERGRFQKFTLSKEEQQYNYRDVWLRKDTFWVFMSELLINLASLRKPLLNVFQNKKHIKKHD